MDQNQELIAILKILKMAKFIGFIQNNEKSRKKFNKTQLTTDFCRIFDFKNSIKSYKIIESHNFFKVLN